MESVLDEYKELEKAIKYKFKDKKLCFKALCHSSYANEANEDIKDNERLEFLGDSVVNLVVGDMLMKHFKKMDEGNLSRIRANLVNEVMLSKLARKISLGNYLKLGKGEEGSGGRDKSSILADAFEAIIAAIYRDGGFEDAYKMVEFMFLPVIENAGKPENYLDPKSRLQELAQMKYKEPPVYKVVSEIGPDHDKVFKVEMRISDIKATGKGKSKKSAEQEAARQGLETLDD
ncbi:MAG: ribonuclease III [Desulforegulaceae bacterium]|nr:ribonuclease III [Desulforegulaceae bacterium]